MRGRYHTGQREEVIGCLAAAEHGHLTAADVCRLLKRAGSTTSTATIYRQLDRLVEEGAAIRLTPEGERSACYELLDKAHCRKGRCHHLKCEECGALIHLSCNEVESLEKHLLDSHGFAINAGRTVFYGVCCACREQSGR